MKIIKKKMHRRPKKHRPSDINRRNKNLNKCINHIPGAPPEYTIVSAEELEKVKDEVFKFWDEGDPEAEWHEITDEDRDFTVRWEGFTMSQPFQLPFNVTTPAPATARKRLPLLRSRSLR